MEAQGLKQGSSMQLPVLLTTRGWGDVSTLFVILALDTLQNYDGFLGFGKYFSYNS